MGKNMQTKINTDKLSKAGCDYSCNVGVIRAKWLDNYGKIIAINYGSGILLSNNIVLTCTHNMYQSYTGLICSTM